MSTFIALHLVTIIPALLIGPFVLARKKGDALHKLSSRVWVALMVVSSLLSFGIRHGGGFSWLHGLSAYTIFAVLMGVISIRRGNLKAHRGNMIGSYCGSLAAFVWAMSPGRSAGDWFWSLF